MTRTTVLNGEAPRPSCSWGASLFQGRSPALYLWVEVEQACPACASMQLCWPAPLIILEHRYPPYRQFVQGTCCCCLSTSCDGRGRWLPGGTGAWEGHE